MLNSYFGAIASVIHAHNGFIDKYIGDGVMAFWIPPFSAGDAHASDACLAALAQQEAMGALRAQLPEITGMRRNPPKLTICMGIATGEAIVGTIGASAARSYTVIGDTVNLASRLEDINKVYGSSIILTEETYRLSQNVMRRENSISSPYPAKPSRYAFTKRWVGPANSAKRTSNCDRFSAKDLPPTDGGTGTTRKRVLKAVSKSPRKTGRRAYLLNASLTCVTHRFHPSGTAFGTFPKSRNDWHNAEFADRQV